MKPRDVRKYLFDIAQACDLIAEFVSGRSFEDYGGDALLRSAVERQFEIIGEALNQALGVDETLGHAITDPRRIVAFGNRLIHGYASVSDEVVWGVIESNLVVLRAEVAALLESD